jgi:hypothetical protein
MNKYVTSSLFLGESYVNDWVDFRSWVRYQTMLDLRIDGEIFTTKLFNAMYLNNWEGYITSTLGA